MTVRFRSTAICIAMTSIKIGSRCGCYTVIASVRIGAQKYRMTMHCNECGREFERGRSAWHELDTTHCICDYLERTQQRSVMRKNAAYHSKQSYEYITRKKEFERYVNSTLKKYPDTKHDDFDTVWNAVGPKPEDTEFVKWYLTRKFRGRRGKRRAEGISGMARTVGDTWRRHGKNMRQPRSMDEHGTLRGMEGNDADGTPTVAAVHAGQDGR